MRSSSLKHNNLMLRSERRERLEAWAASDSPISHNQVLVGGWRIAGGANELIRLQEKGPAFRLSPGKVADRDKGRAKHQANQHDTTVGMLVGAIK